MTVTHQNCFRLISWKSFQICKSAIRLRRILYDSSPKGQGIYSFVVLFWKSPQILKNHNLIYKKLKVSDLTLCSVRNSYGEEIQIEIRIRNVYQYIHTTLFFSLFDIIAFAELSQSFGSNVQRQEHSVTQTQQHGPIKSDRAVLISDTASCTQTHTHKLMYAYIQMYATDALQGLFLS